MREQWEAALNRSIDANMRVVEFTDKIMVDCAFQMLNEYFSPDVSEIGLGYGAMGGFEYVTEAVVMPGQVGFSANGRFTNIEELPGVNDGLRGFAM